MPAKMMSEMPLPTPRSVICSPSHMTNAVPVVSVRIAIRMKPSLPASEPGSRTARWRPLGVVWLQSHSEMPAPWTIERTTVPYRVYCVIFRRPISPSFESFSR